MLDKNKQIWFIGIKGTGMASLALVLHDLGYNVAGSDIDKYTFTQVPLEKAGIKLASFNSNNIKSSPWSTRRCSCCLSSLSPMPFPLFFNLVTYHCSILLPGSSSITTSLPKKEPADAISYHFIHVPFLRHV